MNTYETIEELRKKIKKILKKVPDGKKLVISNAKNLDKLLFDEFIIDEEKGVKFKIPVWNGYFLSRLDLSEVDFSDVSWSIYGMFEKYEYNNNSDSYEQPIFITDDNSKEAIKDRQKDIIKKLKDIFSIEDKEERYSKFAEFTDSLFYAFTDVTEKKFIDTNAKIDFKKSFEYKMFERIYLRCLDLEGTDLSNNDLSGVIMNIDCTNLKDTNIKLRNVKNLQAVGVDFENVDLSSFNVKAFSSQLFSLGDKIERSYDEEVDPYACISFDIACSTKSGFIPCFRNTRLNIQYSNQLLKLFNNFNDKPQYINGIRIKTLHDYLYQSGLFEGCRIDGKTVNSEYMLSEDLLDSIDEQFTRVRKEAKEERQKEDL